METKTEISEFLDHSVQYLEKRHCDEVGKMRKKKEMEKQKRHLDNVLAEAKKLDW